MELELGLSLLVQSLPAIAQIFTALQEERVAILKHQQAKETQSFNPNIRKTIPQENLDFPIWSFEQEKSLQQQLAAYNRETQLQVASSQRETALQLPELQKILNNWDLMLFPSQLLASTNNHQLLPLKIFLSPPKVQSTNFDDVAKFLPEIEHNLAQSLGDFLSKNYCLSSQERPTEFLAGAFANKELHREASIKALFEMLKSEPTLILESEIVGDHLNFRIAYWGLGQQNYCYKTIISKLSYREIVYASAKSRALRWQETARKLLECGESPEEINRLGGDNCFNLKLLKKEEKWKNHGIDTSELAWEYKVSNKDFEALAQLLITCHCLVAGWVADAHHLVHYNQFPLLPKLLPNLLQNAADEELVQALMQTIISGYQDIFKAIEIERPAAVPELALKLAHSLACLPDQAWAKEQVDYSLKVWLKQRQVTLVAGVNSLEEIPSALSREDHQYLESLKKCFAALGDDKNLEKVKAFLGAIEKLNYQQKLDQIAVVQRQTTENITLLEERKKQALIEKLSPIHTLNGHSGKAASIAVSFDRQTIVSGSDDSTIKLWHLGTGELIHTLTGESGRILTIAISSDGKTLASSHKTTEKSWIKIWHLETGKLLRTLTGHHKWVYSLAMTSDGQTLVSGGHKIKVWHLETGEILRTISGHKQWVYSLAITPDGGTIVSSGADKDIKIWNLHTGELIHTLSGHCDWIKTVVISQDGQIIASGSDDKTIKIWDLNTGKIIRTLKGHSDCVLSLVMTPDGQSLISGSRDNTIKFWQLSTGKLLHTLTGHKHCVYSLVVTPDGQTLASGSEDKTIKIWSAV